MGEKEEKKKKKKKVKTEASNDDLEKKKKKKKKKEKEKEKKVKEEGGGVPIEDPAPMKEKREEKQVALEAPLMVEKESEERVSKWAEREAYFFNKGANIAVWAIFLSLNVGMAVW